MDNNEKQRNKTLREINAWCYRRASHLSLNSNEKSAQAFTEEHIEILQNAKCDKILWVEK